MMTGFNFKESSVSTKLDYELNKIRKEFKTELAKRDKRIEWLVSQIKNGMTDLATVTVTKILEEGIEADVVEKTTDEKIKG